LLFNSPFAGYNIFFSSDTEITLTKRGITKI
jgi:hypothetical protein